MYAWEDKNKSLIYLIIHNVILFFIILHIVPKQLISIVKKSLTMLTLVVTMFTTIEFLIFFFPIKDLIFLCTLTMKKSFAGDSVNQDNLKCKN